MSTEFISQYRLVKWNGEEEDWDVIDGVIYYEENKEFMDDLLESLPEKEYSFQHRIVTRWTTW